MNLKSIRWRLALSFAGIALLAAVALGGVLLFILQDYYAKAELEYLAANAKAISNTVAKMTYGNLPRGEIQSQIETLAFLSQTRVTVNDSNGQLLYDVGVPEQVSLGLDVAEDTLPRLPELPGKVQVISRIDKDQLPLILVKGDLFGQPLLPDDRDVTFRYVKLNSSPFGFYLDADVPFGGPRSSQTFTTPLFDSQGKAYGKLVLSEGPAIGRDILDSVARGWALAGAVAVLFAAGVGWFISRRISAPVLALTAVTGRMSAGDLSSRADIQDQDEFGRLARSFNEMADQVETTVATLRRFVSDAAHELQTPVTALRTNLDLIGEEQGTPERAVFIQRAQATVRELQALNTNLLDLSRLETNGQRADEAVIDLTELLRQRSEVYASQAEQAGLAYEISLPSESLKVRAEPSQITRAMDNLVDNACKFTPQGGKVKVQLRPEGEHLVCAVSDTGIGIPADDVPQLFNRFHRGRNATAYPGSGLGLAIVKATVEQQGGSVNAQNLFPGARFTLMWHAVTH